jgi:hypothetical protein
MAAPARRCYFGVVEPGRVHPGGVLVQVEAQRLARRSLKAAHARTTPMISPTTSQNSMARSLAS